MCNPQLVPLTVYVRARGIFLLRCQSAQVFICVLKASRRLCNYPEHDLLDTFEVGPAEIDSDVYSRYEDLHNLIS